MVLDDNFSGRGQVRCSVECERGEIKRDESTEELHNGACYAVLFFCVRSCLVKKKTLQSFCV